MTNEQQITAMKMRDTGQTYGAIAAALGLPCGTVKSFFSRNKSAPLLMSESVTTPVITDNTRCRQCGTTLSLHAGNHMKRFCSERCRQKWWRAHRGQLTMKAASSVCVGCGVVFKNGSNHDRRYCSRACYFRHRFGRAEAT